MGAAEDLLPAARTSDSWATCRSMWRTTARTSGLIPNCFISTIRAADRGLWRAAGLFQRHGTALGKSYLSLGPACCQTDTSGGSSAFALRSRFSTWYGSIISAALNLTGRFRRGETTAIDGRWVKGPGEEFFVGNAERIWRTADCGGESWRDYSAGGEIAAAVWSAGNESFAICVWQRSAGAIVSSA